MDGKTIRNKLVGSDNERAVSPVIGVILMVAITVILAAVIAAFVLDMGDMGENAQAAIDIEGDGTNEVTLSATNLQNADGIILLHSETGEYVVEDGSTDNEFYTDGDSEPGAVDSDGAHLDTVGQTMTLGDEADIGTGSEELPEGDYAVIAYIGNDPGNIEEQNEVQNFEIEN
ncbi:hypothetical protein C482_13034 [Natrialba chahannaoensis JCM 10990]|uniref:Archaeal Type IV pilin N-terminal domain-containing protein n=1 Tax=Natrialba chahannaoensis JCM 10990 TaxID=1227492 RepID=M0AJH8_9EURY|nr:type IV pilin N-terminal domain-containing protein [Natrialba chahannaoensis]ELY97548.1 hypothetical protein C482_13034 [Natrialba chahannaoensis JCM 10990]